MAFIKYGNALSHRPATTVSLIARGDAVKVAGRQATVLAVTSGTVTVSFDDEGHQITIPASQVERA